MFTVHTLVQRERKRVVGKEEDPEQRLQCKCFMRRSSFLVTLE